MNIQSVLFFVSLLLFTSLFQVGEGSWASLPPGRRQLQRKVCISAINEESFVSYMYPIITHKTVNVGCFFDFGNKLPSQHDRQSRETDWGKPRTLLSPCGKKKETPGLGGLGLS